MQIYGKIKSLYHPFVYTSYYSMVESLSGQKSHVFANFDHEKVYFIMSEASKHFRKQSLFVEAWPKPTGFLGLLQVWSVAVRHATTYY